MEDTTYENAVNEELREIHRMVVNVKRDPEVGGMRIQLVEGVFKLSEENAKLLEEIGKIGEENAKMSEEIKKLRGELAQRNAGEK